MTWQEPLDGSALSWLLEPDDPGVRYLALRDVLDCPSDDLELHTARKTWVDVGKKKQPNK